MRSIEKLAEVIRRIAKKENVRIRNIDSSIIRSVGIFDDGSLLSNDTLRSYPSILSLSLSFSREPIGNYAEQSKTERGLTRKLDQLARGRREKGEGRRIEGESKYGVGPPARVSHNDRLPRH